MVVGQNGPLFRALGQVVKLGLVKMERPWRPLVKVVKMGGRTRQYGSTRALLRQIWSNVFVTCRAAAKRPYGFIKLRGMHLQRRRKHPAVRPGYVKCRTMTIVARRVL